MKFNFALPKRLMYKMMMPRFYRQMLHTLVELVSAEDGALHAGYPPKIVARAT